MSMPKKQCFLNIALAAVTLLMPITFAAAAKANSSVEQDLKRTLDQAGLNYTTREQGDFRLHYDLKNGRSQVVVILSSTSNLTDSGNTALSIREIISFIPNFQNGASLEAKKQLLRDSNNKKIGSWVSFKNSQGREDFAFIARIDAKSSPKDLAQFAIWVAETTDEMEQKLFNVDER